MFGEIDLWFASQVIQLFEQLWTDGQEIATAQSSNLVDVAEGSAHDLGLVVELLVVLVDLGDALNSRILQEIELLDTLLGNKPIEDASDKWTDQGDTRFGASNSLKLTKTIKMMKNEFR